MSRSDVEVFWVEVKVGFELIDNGSAAPDIDAQKSQFGIVLHLASGDDQPATGVRFPFIDTEHKSYEVGSQKCEHHEIRGD